MFEVNTPLKKVLEVGSTCNRKNNCCKYGSGFLAPGDLEKISKFMKISPEKLKEEYLTQKEMFNKKLFRPRLKSDKPYGECIFFNGKGCRIHKAKPLQCRIGNCSADGEELSAWFLLNYIVDVDDPESIRQYASYIKCGGKVIPGGKLSDLVPDKKKLAKILNYEIFR